MTFVSNDPIWLSFLSGAHLFDYCAAVAFAAVLYDWALTFGREVELVWMQRWSFMTILYISVRYIGILYSVIIILWYFPISMTDVDCLVVYFIWTWTPVVVNAMLGIIIMIRIHAMFGRSKKILIFLIVVLLSSTIASGVVTLMANIGVSAEESILFGRNLCLYEINESDQLDLRFMSVVPTAIWEMFTFVLAVWIIIKHFRELGQSATGSTIGDCVVVLTKSHAFYFVAFAVVACLTLGSSSPFILFSSAVGSVLYSAFLQVAQVLQMFVLGPRLILSVREYHAELVARSDEGTRMTSLYFQARGDTLTGGDV